MLVSGRGARDEQCDLYIVILAGTKLGNSGSVSIAFVERRTQEIGFAWGLDDLLSTIFQEVTPLT